MASEKPLMAGVKYGLLAGLIYIVLLLLQYTFPSESPIAFAGIKLVIYLIIIGVFVFAAIARKKELGGYADFKTVFQTIFITIVITEVLYAAFNYIYLNYIDPQFLDTVTNNTITWLEKKGLPQEQLDKQIETMKERSVKPSLRNTFVGIGIWVIIDSIFGLIIAAIVKKNKPLFDGSTNQ